MKKLKEQLIAAANIVIGFAILSIILPPISFFLGFVINQIVDAFKYGWQLW